ncbi:MAG: DUF4390 domain-containing protein [Steroidobacteraceae bacterium]
MIASTVERRALGVARLLAAALALWLVLSAPVARADALDGVLEVQSAFVNLADGVYQLHARIEYPLNEETAAALREGVSLSYDLDVEVARARRFWFDAGLATLTLRRELTYHAVSERYVVRDPRSGAQSSFATLEEALISLGTVDGWPILVASQVPREVECRVSVRASVRRGKLPEALRVILFWNDGWQRASEWYSWSLPR